jgi:hypothetical protein
MFLKFSQDIAKDVTFEIVFGFLLILDILIIRSNSHKRFRNILQSSKKSPYQRKDEINKHFRTQFFRTTILLYKNDIFINISLFIMLCQFHTIISAQIQTQEYTNYQSINGRVYATALRQLQQPLQNKHDTFYIRSLVI